MKGKFIAIVLLVAVLAGTLAPVASAAFEPYLNTNGIVVNGKGEIYLDYCVTEGSTIRFCDASETGAKPFCLRKAKDGVFYLANRDGNFFLVNRKPIPAEPDNPILVRAKREHATNSMRMVFCAADGSWKCLTANPLLVAFCASGLLVLGFRIFHKARRAPE